MKHLYFVQKFEETTTFKERKKIKKVYLKLLKFYFLKLFQIFLKFQNFQKLIEIKRNFLHW